MSRSTFLGCPIVVNVDDGGPMSRQELLARATMALAEWGVLQRAFDE